MDVKRDEGALFGCLARWRLHRVFEADGFRIVDCLGCWEIIKRTIKLRKKKPLRDI